jgi:hypothetical protein
VRDSGRPEAKIDESAEVRELEGLISETYSAVRERVKKEDAEAARLAALANGDNGNEVPDPAGEAKGRGRGRIKRRLTHSATTDLDYARQR